MRRVLCSLSFVFAVGCSSQKEQKPVQAAETAPVDAKKSDAMATNAAKSCSYDIDCGGQQLCIRNQCVDITPDLAECQASRVHFAYDSSEISTEDKQALDRTARCLKADQVMHVTIEGNADERGTEEYNLALGDRRATAVSKYLEMAGASEKQLKTVSYGKEHPLCVEHDEACWGKNRRAAVKPEVATKQSKTKK